MTIEERQIARFESARKCARARCVDSHEVGAAAVPMCNRRVSSAGSTPIHHRFEAWSARLVGRERARSRLPLASILDARGQLLERALHSGAFPTRAPAGPHKASPGALRPGNQPCLAGIRGESWRLIRDVAGGDGRQAVPDRPLNDCCGLHRSPLRGLSYLEALRGRGTRADQLGGRSQNRREPFRQMSSLDWNHIAKRDDVLGLFEAFQLDFPDAPAVCI